MKLRLWEFWIDVGGTFTDCIARRPDGSIRQTKVLSTGRVRGVTAAGSTPTDLLDPARCGDPPRFFDAWSVEVSIGDGPPHPARVVAFDARHGRFTITPPLGDAPPPGSAYELSCGLEAPLVGLRWLMGLPLDQPIPPVDVRLGTTRGTNALLERRGARVAFVTTAGLADVLRIGHQARPRLFDLSIRKPDDLYEQSIEVRERIAADGRVLEPLDEHHARAQLRQARDHGIESVAICLMNSYRNPAHEDALARIARELGFAYVSVSSELAALQRLVPRGETTVVNAYLAPPVDRYVRDLRSHLPGSTLRLMTSAGGLVAAEEFVAKDSVLSGPAGGVIGAAAVARAAGFPRAIGFDMGGTSTDVSRFDGDFERRYEMAIQDRASGGSIRVLAPMLAIETVAAGGGSICDFDGVMPTVGPHSAGADPGPACYGRGGPLCLTDANLLLGRVPDDHFPFPLDRQAAQRALRRQIERIAAASGRRYEPEELARGYIAIANAHMAAAIRRVSIERGVDPRDYALVAFGGAAGQHACAIARDLAIRTILLHPLAGLLSAVGIGRATVARFAAIDVHRPLADVSGPRLDALFADLETTVRRALARDAVPGEDVADVKRFLELRYRGQDSTFSIAQPANRDWQRAFEEAHRRCYGFAFEGRPIEVTTARLEAHSRPGAEPLFTHDAPPAAIAPPAASDRASRETSARSAEWPIRRREDLDAGDRLAGPCLIAERGATVVVEPGWTGELRGDGVIVLRDEGAETAPRRTRASAPANPAPADAECDPVTLELFHHRFASIAEQMGSMLQRTALSTNVKERLDFSCAVFDGRGDLVSHAPHIPVHLGAMGQCVRCLLDDAARRPGLGPIRPGDVFLSNDPYRGGSHLPDLTVITPVFAADDPAAESSPTFFVASRAHHAEIGGASPGSMPPDSRRLADEGVLIRMMRLPPDESSLRRLFETGRYPSRASDQNLADTYAQVAANRRGVELLRELASVQGVDRVLAYMGHIRRAAELKARAALRRLPDRVYEFRDRLDDGSPIAVRITKRGDAAVFDFAGSGHVSPTNLNATPPIVASAVLYCLRCLIGEDAPLNAGILAPVTILVPPGLLNPPAADDPDECPAVVGGNVETSQRIVDCILGALGLAAASQGTMNNLTFGTDAWGYYETIGGGAGAGPGFAGASAVHTHMTNTRLTDPEVLEARYPVRLRRFQIRRASGGAGRWPGGDGIVREIEFCADLELSLLTQRRTTRPFGLLGGGDGASGRNVLFRASGAEIELPWAARRTVGPGDRLRIETPGGGGYGMPHPATPRPLVP